MAALMLVMLTGHGITAAEPQPKVNVIPAEEQTLQTQA
jgi:hypothetical protein